VKNELKNQKKNFSVKNEQKKMGQTEQKIGKTEQKPKKKFSGKNEQKSVK
jgi:hypothetical protein